MAVILVDAEGENVIVVAPGANAQVGRVETGGNVLAQLEIADDTVISAAESAERFFLNAAPARPLPAAVVQAADSWLSTATSSTRCRRPRACWR